MRYSRLARDERIRVAARLSEEYEAGAAIRTLATRYQFSYGRVYRLLKEQGVSLRPRGGWNRKTIPVPGE